MLMKILDKKLLKIIKKKKELILMVFHLKNLIKDYYMKKL